MNYYENKDVRNHIEQEHTVKIDKRKKTLKLQASKK